MKNFKKALLLGLAFLGVGAITACNNNNSGSGTTDVTDAATEAIDKVLFPQNDTEVTGNFDVVGSVKYNGETYNLTWTSDKDVIKFNTADGKTKAIVNFTGNTQAAQEVTLTVSVTVAEKTVKRTFKVTVPKFTVNTLAEADAAAAKTTLTLKGVIVAKEPYSTTNKNTSVYLMCDGGGYEAYRLACTQDQYDKELVVGNTIYVSGPKGYYNGLRELNTCTYVFDENAAKVTVTAEDLTSLVSAGTGIADTYQCHLAKLTDVEIVKIDTPDSSGQYSIYVGDPTDDTKQAVVRISKYFFTGKTADDYQFKDLNLVAGQKITVTGFVGWYNGAQITPIAADGIVAGQVDYASGLASAYATAAEKAIGAQVIPMKTIKLPSRLKDVGLSGEEYEAYTIEWSSENTNVSITTEDVAAVEAQEAVPATETTPEVPAVEAEDAYTLYKVTTSQPEEDTDVTLTLTIKDASGTVVKTRDVTFKLLKEVTYNTYAEFIAAEAGTELYIQGTIIAQQYTSSVKKYYIQDTDGNVFYIKSDSNVETNEWFGVGKTIGLFGKKNLDSNMPVLEKTVFIESLGTSNQAVVYTDYTETFTTTGITKDVVEAALLKPVTFTGELKSVSGSNYVVTVGENDVTVYTYVTTKPSFAANDKVKVSGLLGFYYNSSTYTYQVFLLDTAKMESNATDEEKLASAKTAVLGVFEDKTYAATTQIQIPVKFNATIELNEALDESGVLAWDQTSKKVTITPTSELAEKTLKLKITVGTANEVVEIAIKAQLPGDGSTVVSTDFSGNTSNYNCVGPEVDVTKLGLSADIFEGTAAKNDSTGNNAVFVNATQLRLYGKDGNGTQITISAKSGYTIKSIKITFAEATTNCQVTNAAGTVLTATDDVYTINSTSFTLKDIVASGTTQVRISSIEITYAAVSE